MMEKKKKKPIKGKIEVDRTGEKAPDASISSNPEQKIQVLEEYYNYDSMRQIPISQGTLERLIENGIKWARTNDDAIKMTQFLDLNGIPKDTWDKWRNKYPEVEVGNKIILSILGNRRELYMLKRKFDPGTTMRAMWIYDEDWRKIGEWWANLTKKETISHGGPQVVFLEKIPDSPLVPIRKVKDNE